MFLTPRLSLIFVKSLLSIEDTLSCVLLKNKAKWTQIIFCVTEKSKVDID